VKAQCQKQFLFVAIVFTVVLVPRLTFAALTIDGHNTASGGGTPISLTTTNTNDIIVAHFFAEAQSGSVISVNTVSDNPGNLTWHLRSATSSANINSAGGHSDVVDDEVWWALAPSTLSSDSISYTWNGTVDCQSGIAFGVTGANTSNPWDANSSLPAKAQDINNDNIAPSVSGVSTNVAKTMLLGFMGTGQNGSDGSGAAYSAGSRYSVIDQVVNGACGDADSGVAQYKVVSQKQTNVTVALGTAEQGGWMMIGDAIVDASQPAAGRIIRLPGHVRLIGGARLGGSSPVVCTQAQGFFARASGLDSIHKRAYNDLICGLVNAGIWSKLDVLYIFAAPDSTTALLNLVNSSFTATAQGSPTFTADRGYAVSATDNYVSSNYNFSTNGTNYTQDSASMGGWSAAAGSTFWPAWDTNTGFGGNTNIITFDAGDIGFTINDTFQLSVGNDADGSGMFVAVRPNSSTAIVYRNGVSFGSVSQTSVALENGVLETGGDTTNALNHFSGTIRAMFAGGSLSPTDVSTFYGLMSTYMRAVGAAP
jgi:hypothetical protein